MTPRSSRLRRWTRTSAPSRRRTNHRHRAAAAPCRPASCPSVDQRDRHLLAVAGRAPRLRLRFVVRGIVAAEDLLPLEQRPLLRVQVVLVDGRRRDHRLVGVADACVVSNSGLPPSAHRVIGLVGRDAVERPTRSVAALGRHLDDPQVGQPALALRHDEVVLEEGQRLDLHRRIVRDEDRSSSPRTDRAIGAVTTWKFFAPLLVVM